MGHTRRGMLTMAVAGALALAGRGARATVAAPISVEELTRRADDVVIGTARRAASRWDGGAIVTDWEIEVATALKGRLPARSRILVRLPGGVVGRIGQVIPGASALAVDGTYVLFLSGGFAGVRYLAHLTAAVMPVAMDPASGRVEASLGAEVTSLGGRGVGVRPAALDAVVALVRGAGP